MTGIPILDGILDFIDTNKGAFAAIGIAVTVGAGLYVLHRERRASRAAPA